MSSASTPSASRERDPGACRSFPARLPYALETLRPSVSLAFVLPILFAYEAGVILIATPGVRNGMDTGTQWLMNSMGLGHLLLLPIVTVSVLLLRHHRARDRWHIQPAVLTGMAIESIALGAILVFAAKGYQLWFELPARSTLLSFGDSHPVLSGNSRLPERLICSLGAGLYEELVFRLLLLAGVIGWMRKVKVPVLTASVLGALATSVAFALVHYQPFNPAGSAFEVPTFAVRILASLFLCAVFLFRGFGVAVGTHVAYDIAVTLATEPTG